MEEKRIGELSDEKLNDVSGGVCSHEGGSTNSQDKRPAEGTKKYCKHCQKNVTAISYSGSRYFCAICNYPIDGPII